MDRSRGWRPRGARLALVAIVLMVPAAGRAGEALETAGNPPTAWGGMATDGMPAHARLWRGLREGSLTVEDLLMLRARMLANPGAPGARGLVMPALLAEEARTADEAEHGGSEALAIPLSVGDLDGDGADDVLTLEFTFFFFAAPVEAVPADDQEDITLRALSGIDGHELWRTGLGFFDGFYVGDLDDAAGKELVVVRAGVEYGTVITLDQRLEVLDGATGEVRWDWAQTGEVFQAYHFSDTAVGDQYAFLAAFVVGWRNVVLSIQPMVDASGDGADDLFIGSVDIASAAAYAFTGPVGQGIGIAAGRFTGRSLAGSDGGEIGTFSSTVLNTLPYGIPTSDLSGDGAADIVFLESGSGGGTVLRAMAVTGTEHWRTSVDPGFPYAPGDLTGDGLADIVMETFDFEEDFGLTYSIVDGSDGSTAWTRETGGLFPFTFTGDVDADGGQDLIMVGWTFDETVGLRAEVWSGADGQEIWSRVVPGLDDILLCFCPTDLTADGSTDILVAPVTWTEDGIAGEVHAIDGADGATLWSNTEVSSFDELPLPLGADADGDGADDLFWVARDELQPEVLTAFVHRGIDLATAWSVALQEWPTGFLIEGFGADLVEGSEAELVFGLGRYTEEGLSSRVEAYGPGGRIWPS